MLLSASVVSLYICSFILLYWQYRSKDCEPLVWIVVCT